MYDVTSTNGHSEDYYQVPLKKNLKLERRKYINLQHNIQHTRENTTKRKKLERKESPVVAKRPLRWGAFK